MNRNKNFFRTGAVLLILSVFIFSACKKYDTAFEESPDQRINAALKKYESALVGSPAGWNATIRTQNGSLYHFHFRFNNANRVNMFSDFSLETATTARESSYRLKALQTPSLLFDTYSYLHILSDPDASVNGGDYGLGLAMDFEFSLDSLTADSVLLTGKVHGTKLTLVKATQADFDAWQNGRWATTVAFENINKIQNYFRRVNIGGVNYDVRTDPVARTVTFTWVDANGNNRQFTTSYYYSATGVVFVSPFNTGTQTLNGLEIVSWDAANSILNIKINGTATAISGATKPLKIDLTAPSKWLQMAVTNDLIWISIDGFHVNGVDDAFGVKTLPNYYAMVVYWPNFYQNNSLFAPIFINAAGNGITYLYGAAPVPQLTNDGRAVFTNAGFYLSYPSTGPARQSLDQLLIPQGYYFVQTGPSSFDMVSSTDAKAWISLELVQ